MLVMTAAVPGIPGPDQIVPRTLLPEGRAARY